MPVLVAPADTSLGALSVARILREGGEVRAYCAGGTRATADRGRLRAAGAILADGDLDDEGRLEAAMAQVHTVVHLGPDLFSPAAGVVRQAAQTVVRAATNAGVQRLIVTSVVGAGARKDDELRATAAEVERSAAAAPVPSVIVRLGLVDEPQVAGLLANLPSRQRVELQDVPVRPLAPMDVAELVAAFDAARSTADTGHVVFAAHGRQRRLLSELFDRAGGSARPYVAPDVAPLAMSALAGPWIEPDPEVFDAFRFTGLTPQTVD